MQLNVLQSFVLRLFTLSAVLTMAGTSSLAEVVVNTTAGTITGDGAYADAIALTANTTVTPSSGNTITLNGALSGAFGLTLASDNLTLAAANSYSGGTTITAGTLKITHANALGGGAVTLNGGTLEIGANLTVANNIVAAANTSSTIYRDGELTLSGKFSGSGTITTAGTGNNSTRLSGDNSGFSGTFNSSFVNTIFTSADAGSSSATWNITTGTLSTQNIAADSFIKLGALSGSGELFNDSTGLNTFVIGEKLVNATDSATFSGKIQNNYNNAADNRIVAITKVGTGTQTLSGNSTYTGVTTIDGGTLKFQRMAGSGNGYLNTSEFKINNGSTLQFGKETGAGNQIWFQAAGGNKFTFDSNGGGTIDTGTGMNLVLNAATTTFTTNGGAKNLITGTSGFNFNYADAVITFNVAKGTDAGGVDLDVSAPLWNNGGTVVKTGAGTMVLSGANTYTKGTTISEGTLKIIGTAKTSGFDIAEGATLIIDTTAGNRDFGASQTFTGSGTFIKTGANNLRWGGAVATFAMTGGEIRVEGGTLTGGSNNNEIWTNNKSSLYVASGATFAGVEANVRVDALTGSGTISTGYTPSGTSYRNFTFGVNNGSGTFSGTLSNGNATGNVVKEGTGTQTFTGTLSYTGTTTISAGTISIDGTAKIGTGAITVNGTLALNDTTQTLTNLSGSGTVTGTQNLTLKVTGNDTCDYTGNIQIGSATLIKTDTGRTRLGKTGGASSTIGAYRIQGGYLCLPSSLSSNTSSITLDGGVLQKNGDTRTADGDASDTTLANPIFVTSNGGGLMAGWHSNLVLTGSISDEEGQTGGTLRIVADSGSVVLSGAGVVNLTGFLDVNSALTLSKNTTFGGLTGSSNVQNNGVLTLNVAAGATPNFAGTLSGSGSLIKTGDGVQTFSNSTNPIGPMTISAGSIELAPNANAYNLNQLTIAKDATLVLDIASDTDFAKIHLDDVPTYEDAAGFLDLAFVGGYTPSSTSQSYNLIGGALGTEDLNLTDWLLPNLRYEWGLNWYAGTNSLILQRDANAVPEPSTCILLLLGAFGLIRLRRKNF